MYRILGLDGGSGPTELNNIFQPAAGVQFIVRLVDKTGHTQFLAACPGTPTGIGAGGQPYVDVDPLTPVQLAQHTGTVGGLSGYGSGSLVNPVQIVHWEIVPAQNEPPQYASIGGQPLTPAVVDPAKYDLVREYVDAKSAAPVLATMEVVAEYAVDLEFAFSVDAGTNLQPLIKTFAFDTTADNPNWAQNIGLHPPVAGVAIGPQRIRSVRVRLATRASEPDRTLNVPVLNPTGPFTYRYCVLLNGCTTANATAGILQYARARTLTGEVALPNQSRNYYP